MRHLIALPTELLCAIIGFLPLKDRIAVTQVCQVWRKLALEARAELWAQIHWGPSSTMDVLAARLARAGTALIDLRVDVLPWRFPPAAAIIEPYIGQLQSLCIDIDAGPGGHGGTIRPTIAALLGLLTSRPAPQLKSLTVFLDGMEARLTSPLFLNTTPRLTHVNFTCFEYVCAAARHPTVKILCLETEELHIPRQLHNYLRPFPGLEVLDILSEEYHANRGPGPMAALPAGLDALVLGFQNRKPIPTEVLDVIPHGDVKQVEYREDYEDKKPDFRNAPSFPSQEEAIIMQGLQLLRPVAFFISFILYDSDGDSSAITYELEHGLCTEVIMVDNLRNRRVFSASHKMFAPSFLSQVIVLNIREEDLYIWYLHRRTSDGPARFDALESLVVHSLLEINDYAEDTSWRSPFFISLPYPTVFEAPRLHSITFTTDEEVTFAPEMISEFLLHFLGRTIETPLELLELRNVRILEHNIAEVARLTLFAPKIDFRDDGLEYEYDVANLADFDDIDFS